MDGRPRTPSASFAPPPKPVECCGWSDEQIDAALGDPVGQAPLDVLARGRSRPVIVVC
jgi:hypothetical protein